MKNKPMTDKERKEHMVAEKIRKSMEFVAEKANDIKRCSDYSIADEAADMLEYVKDEIDDTLRLVGKAKQQGLFCDEKDNDDCESLETLEAIYGFTAQGEGGETL